MLPMTLSLKRCAWRSSSHTQFMAGGSMRNCFPPVARGQGRTTCSTPVLNWRSAVTTYKGGSEATSETSCKLSAEMTV